MDNELIKEVSKSIQGLYELTTRVDIQVSNIKEHIEKTDERLEAAIKSHNNLLGRVMILESKNGKEIVKKLDDIEIQVKAIGSEQSLLDRRLYIVESSTRKTENIWAIIIDYIWKGIFLLAMGYLFWRFGIAPPL